MSYSDESAYFYLNETYLNIQRYNFEGHSMSRRIIITYAFYASDEILGIDMLFNYSVPIRLAQTLWKTSLIKILFSIDLPI